jgi:hypothetical protein
MAVYGNWRRNATEIFIRRCGGLIPPVSGIRPHALFRLCAAGVSCSASTVGVPATAGVSFTRAVIVPAAAFCTTQPIAAALAMPTTPSTRVTLDTSAITSNGWFGVSRALQEVRRGERHHDFGGSRLTLQSLLLLYA